MISLYTEKKKKPFNQLDTEETYLNIKKATEEKAHSKNNTHQ